MTTQLLNPITTTLIEVTPELAQHLLNTMPYKYQRGIRKWKVTELASAMMEDRFFPATTIRVMKLDGKEHLIDGQHRLRAVIESGKPQLFNVVEEAARDDRHIALVYGALDTGLKRTSGDLFRALELSEKLGLSKADVGNLGSAVTFLSTGCIRAKGKSTLISQTALEQGILLYAPFMRDYIGIIAGCSDHIRMRAVRSATLGFALLTMRYSLPRAINQGDPDVIEFWKGAVLDDGISVGDPRKLVNRHLMIVGISGSAISGGDFVSANYSVRYIAGCFNAYMAREQRTRTYVRDANAPLNAYGISTDYEEWMR